MAGKPWTEEEKTFIRENYLKMTNREMAEALGTRTRRAVEHFCNLNALERPEPKKGDKIGNWELLSDKYLVEGRNQLLGMVKARCKCGVEKEVKLTSIVSGVAVSCGCVKREKARERCKVLSRTHGMTNHPLYSLWIGMINRCTYPSQPGFDNYGGRGIQVCDEWRNFGNFSEWCLTNGWKPGLCLDRRETDGNYEPSNCRFLTYKENCNNKRNNRLITAFGETKTLSQWVDDPRCQTEYMTIRDRIDLLGWAPERAITTPTRQLRRQKLQLETL